MTRSLGKYQESDHNSLLHRFLEYINSMGKATKADIKLNEICTNNGTSGRKKPAKSVNGQLSTPIANW